MCSLEPYASYNIGHVTDCCSYYIHTRTGMGFFSNNTKRLPRKTRLIRIFLNITLLRTAAVRHHTPSVRIICLNLGYIYNIILWTLKNTRNRVLNIVCFRAPKWSNMLLKINIYICIIFKYEICFEIIS